MAEQRVFQIQLEGLIQLLAQNLYADPDVFLREMIQNAHDSIKFISTTLAQRQIKCLQLIHASPSH